MVAYIAAAASSSRGPNGASRHGKCIDSRIAAHSAGGASWQISPNSSAYRYRLTRRWGDGPALMFIQLRGVNWWDGLGSRQHGNEYAVIAARDLIGTVPGWTRDAYGLVMTRYDRTFGLREETIRETQ